MWQRRLVKCALSVVAGALLLAPATAQAQIFMPFFGMGGFGGFGGGGGPFGLYGRSYMPFYSSGFSPYFGNMYPGMGMGMGMGYNPMMSGMFNPAMYNSSYAYSGPVMYAGFSSQGYAARMRPTIYPALALKSDAPIRAAGYEIDSSRARIEVIVPSADAQVWIQGTPMTQTGKVRQFVSPPLDSDSRYSYDIRVRSGEQTDTRHIQVRAGSRAVVDFTSK